MCKWDNKGKALEKLAKELFTPASSQGFFFFFGLTPEVRRFLKIVLGKWASLRHMI